MREIDLFPLWLSLRVAALSTLFVVVAGVALAWILTRHGRPAAGSEVRSAGPGNEGPEPRGPRGLRQEARLH